MFSKKGLTVKISVTQDKMPALRKALSTLADRQVLAGVPDEKAGRRKKGQKVNNATLAYIHNTGSPSQNIPQREFMRSGVKMEQETIQRHMRNAGKYALEGNLAAVEKELHAVGLAAQRGMRNKLHSGPFAPLKPATLAARRRRGRTGENPLEDTGQLRNALSYVLDSKKRGKG